MELYKEDLLLLNSLIDYVEHIGTVDGVFEVEVRVRLDDTYWWAVLGYGEAGDPCVLRFEKDAEPVKITYPNININPAPSPYIHTINTQSVQATCGVCGKFRHPSATVCTYCHASDDDE